MFCAANIHYEIADRVRGLAYGGIEAMHLLARQIGLAKAIDQKLHLPYHESDHVLNIAYNILCNGDCLEDIERLRNDEVYLDALGAERIPDPTTTGDFCDASQEKMSKPQWMSSMGFGEISGKSSLKNSLKKLSLTPTAR